MAKKSVDPMLQRVYEVLQVETQEQVCEMLRRSHTTLTRWLQAGKGVPEDWLWQIAATYDVRFEWLQRAKAPKWDPRQRVDQLSAELREVVALGRELPKARQASLVQTARVFSSDVAGRLADDLAELTAVFDETIQYRRQHFPRTRHP